MNTAKRIAIGCDSAAVEMKTSLKEHLEGQGMTVTDFGVVTGDESPYADIAHSLASSIRDQKEDLGVLCCGTGIGMAITANKVPGVRAAQAHDTYSAERARKSNNAHIVTIGARVVGSELAKSIVDAFVASEFDSERSGDKVDRISHYEQLELQRA